MQNCKRWFWPALCLSLVMCWVWSNAINAGLREQVSALRKVVAIQDQWCTGLSNVNAVCEETMVDLAARLGLDTDWMPLVTTALWHRAGNMPIRKARKELGAPAWQKAPPLGWPTAQSGIGGGTEADERLLVESRGR